MEEKKKGGRAALYLLLFALAVGADQLLKRYIVAHIPLDPAPADHLPLLPGVVHLTHIHNYGAAFSMLQGRRWFFLGLLGLFCVLVVVAIRKQWLEDEFSRVLAVLAAGGAVGNGIDRAALGYVVDMFEVEFMHFAVFNLADAILCVCAALYTVKTLWEMAEEKRGKV
ncbi:MAG: signal peptidase II [Oscillospiraceae bacterium]|nr:signal peptidase II [Oscillospiraceae bacterium]